jgi:hypothetical protein
VVAGPAWPNGANSRLARLRNTPSLKYGRRPLSHTFKLIFNFLIFIFVEAQDEHKDIWEED